MGGWRDGLAGEEEREASNFTGSVERASAFLHAVRLDNGEESLGSILFSPLLIPSIIYSSPSGKVGVLAGQVGGKG